MLKVRVMPTLLWKGPTLVKGESFDSWRRVGTLLPAIKVYNTREVDELVLLDITATGEAREPDYLQVKDCAAACFVPFTVGGGIRSIEHIRQLLRAGADKVAINSAAFEMPDLITQAAQRFGSQCVVMSLDARVNPAMPSGYECYQQCGKQPTGQDIVQWAETIERLGAGEILLTSVERDGMMQGYDLALLKAVSRAVSIPVIASGGAGNYQHMLAALQEGQAAAVAAASIFHFTEQTPLEAKAYLAQHGIPVRL